MDEQTASRPLGQRIAYVLAFLLVIVGMVNTMPEIPGLQNWAREITGQQFFRVSGFQPEFFYPPVFFVMMLIVALNSSVYRSMKVEKPRRAWKGLLLDGGLILAAFLGAFGYLVEIDSVCLIDQITGERARLVQEALERSEGVIPGISFEAEVPACQARFGIWIIPLLFTIITLFFLYNVRVWGLPLVIVASIVVLYTVGTALIWMFDLSDNNFLLTKLGADGGDVRAAAIQKATNVFITPDGFMGRFMDIVVNQVFPYVILGALFGSSAGGTSLIKLAVRLTRRLRGGPAHAAIVSSAMFGTITGGPVTNVLSTGATDHPDDAAQRFLATVRGRRRSGSVFRRTDHAPGHGGRGLRPRRPDGGALHQGHHGGLPARDVLLLFDLPGSHVPGPARKGRGDARHPRRPGDGAAGLVEPCHHFPADPDDPVPASGQQGCDQHRVPLCHSARRRDADHRQRHGRCGVCRLVGGRGSCPIAVP